MSNRLRHFALVVVGVGLAAGNAVAQDRLFTLVPTPAGSRAVEIGAIGRFGEVLGPAPSDVLDFPGKARLFDTNGTTVTNASTGTVLFTAGPPEIIVAVESAHDRATVFVQTIEQAPPFVQRPRLRALDGTTGATKGEVASSYTTLVWDPVGRRLLAWDWRGRAFDVFAEDLTLLGRADMPGSRCTDPTGMVVSPHSGRAYIGYSAGSFTYGVNSAVVFAVDLAASRFVGQADLGGTGGPECAWPLILWSAPAPPVGLTATVSGHDVTLSWIPADYAAGYVLDAGIGSGRTDLTVPVGATTQVSFANVPAGTYYLRVRGGNRMGGGRPSNEVRVVVP